MLDRLRRVAPVLLRPEGAVLAIGIFAFIVWLLFRNFGPGADAVDLRRLAGADRYATAAQLALEARPDGAETIIVARGDEFADAVAAGALVGPTDGAVLLTPADELTPAVRDAIEELDADTAYLLGGEAAVGPGIEEELAVDHEVIRLSGETRIGTAAAVAREVGQLDALGEIERRRTAFVVNAEAFPDALAASSASAGGAFPILLTARDELSAETAEALEELDVERVIVIGGSAVISLPVTIALEQAGYVVETISGPDRAATAARVADRFVSETLVLDDERAVLARGDAFADALAAGAYGGITEAPLLLAPAPDDPGDATLRYLAEEAGDLEELVVVGGEAAITPEAARAARAAASGTLPPDVSVEASP